MADKFGCIGIPDHERYWTELDIDWENYREGTNWPRKRVNGVRYRYAAVLPGNDLEDLSEGYGLDFVSIEGYATDDADDLRGLRGAWCNESMVRIWDFETHQFV